MGSAYNFRELFVYRRRNREVSQTYLPTQYVWPYFVLSRQTVYVTLRFSAMSVENLIKLATLRSTTRSGAARSLRMAAGLSLREVAGAIDVSVPTIWRWETADRVPRNSEAALRYAELLEALANRNRPHRRQKGAA